MGQDRYFEDREYRQSTQYAKAIREGAERETVAKIVAWMDLKFPDDDLVMTITQMIERGEWKK